jgi:hypothetical protein
MTYRTSLVIIALAVCAQVTSADPQTERIRKLAAENGAALASGNYARLVDLTYPKVVEMIGGRDKMIDTLRRGSEDMKAHGSAILGAEVSEPKEVVTAGDKQFAIVPMTVRLQIPDGTLRSKGFLIAISEDRGKTWTFIDSAGITKEPGKEREKLAQVVPDFPTQLSVPPREPPVLEPK